jgi:hypothetical protein
VPAIFDATPQGSVPAAESPPLLRDILDARRILTLGSWGGGAESHA